MRVIDFQIQDEGSIVLLRPLTTDAKEWLETNLSEDAQYFGSAAVVEPRYIWDIVNGFQSEGLCL